MTPSEYVKSHGLRTLAFVAKESGCQVRTLNNWWHTKHKLFITVVRGVKLREYDGDD